jgi:hypothetical protein
LGSLRTSPKLIPEEWQPPVLASSNPLSTRHQRFACARLSQSYLPKSRSDLLDRVIEVIRIAHKLAPTTQAWWVVERSLRGRWSKVWVHGDGKPFQGADRNEFRPKRWVENSPLSHWLAAPIPEAPAIDIKGSWIDVVTGELRQDPNKNATTNYSRKVALDFGARRLLRSIKPSRRDASVSRRSRPRCN